MKIGKKLVSLQIEMTKKNTILNQVRNTAHKVLPQGTHLWLFGSQARGDASEGSDWDFLLLLDKGAVTNDDYRAYAYPFVQLGWNLGEYFSVKVYTSEEWQRRSGTPFYKNVTHDAIAI